MRLTLRTNLAMRTLMHCAVRAPDMLRTADVARAFLDVYRLTRNTVVEEIVLRPQLGDL